MISRYLTLLILLPLSLSAAEPWQFGAAIPVTGTPQASVFHHLDSAGRKNIALSANRVAITWEDNSSGQPQIYFSGKNLTADSFEPAVRISSGKDAYEPAITGLDDGRFILTWEEDGAVLARVITGNQPGTTIKLSGKSAGHATIASGKGEVYAAWREKRGRHSNIHITRLDAGSGTGLQPGQVIPIEPTPVNAPQLYPTIAVSPAGIALAWEDRREGHTRLLFSHSEDGKHFTKPGNLNEFRSNRNEYDKGNGVTRVALATLGEDEIIAAWMDKRRGKTGYGIYASMGYEGGLEYSGNERVQSEKGDRLPHYNPSVSGNNDGDFIVTWDDYRNGDSDIWLSTYNDDLVWSEDFAPAAASGSGEQSNPTVVMDRDGNLHLAWIQTQAIGQPGAIWYAFGKKAP